MDLKVTAYEYLDWNSVTQDSRQGVVLQLGVLSVGLTTLHRKKLSCYENSQEASDMDRFFK
jgi:hypothetical protein